MNIIRMTGGLGNQMFQYALYLSFRDLGIECKFDDFSEYEDHDNARPIQLGKFGIDYPRATREEVREFTDGQTDLLHKIRRKLFGRRSREYREASCNFDEQVLMKDDAYLTGYFQTEKYFRRIRDEILKTFDFPDELENVWDKIAGDIKKPPVALHMRRGDYLTTADVFGGICTSGYYEKAIWRMEELAGDVHFLIFSDDPVWAENTAYEWNKAYCGDSPEKMFTAVTENNEDNGFIDLFLMSRCDHQIMANSSFSWWGSYLNQNLGKRVIAPGRWFNTQDCRDIYTDYMIRI